MITCVLTVLYFLQFIESIPVTLQNKLPSYAIPESARRSFEKSLGFIEDTYLNFTELTTKYGYHTQQHTVTTEDGYLLTVFRILTKCPQTQRFPVVLGHGVIDSSDAWILTGPEKGLGYILSQNCYDVWAVNFRGNVYSRNHIRLDPNNDPAYWEFSFDEIGIYDMPALIDYILYTTGQPKVSYIGHSQGTTNFLVMGSLRPDYNEKIHVSILLAPIAWMKNIRSPIPKILARSGKELRIILESAGFSELLAKHQLTHLILELICQFAPYALCSPGLSLGTGYRLGNIDSKSLAIVFGHIPVGVSAKTLAHFTQLITSGKFQRYDEGKSENLKKYDSEKPPKYDVSLITLPVVLFSGRSDWLSSLKDVDILSAKLPNLVENYVVPDPYWSHNDHIWAVNATELVFDRVLYYLQT